MEKNFGYLFILMVFNVNFDAYGYDDEMFFAPQDISMQYRALQDWIQPKTVDHDSFYRFSVAMNQKNDHRQETPNPACPCSGF